MLSETMLESLGTMVVDKVPFFLKICLSAKESLQTCTSVVNLDV